MGTILVVVDEQGFLLDTGGILVCWPMGKVLYWGPICGPGCGSYEALWCWEEMRSQVEAGWGLEANLIWLSCFWIPWTSLSLVIFCLSPCSRLEEFENGRICDSCGR